MSRVPGLLAALLLAGCAPEAAEEASPLAAAPSPAREVSVARASPREAAYGLVAMVEAWATRPQPSASAWEVELADDPCAGLQGEIGRFGAAVVVGRDAEAVYLATPEHVAFPCHWQPSRVELRFHARPLNRYAATPLADRDEALDLAVLRVPLDAGLAAALDRQRTDLVRPAAALRLFDGLQTIGNPDSNAWYLNPFGLDLFDRLEDDRIGFHARLLTVGNSGGGLFTEDWRLVGMVLSEHLPFGQALAIERIEAELRAWSVPVTLELPELPPEPPPPVSDCEGCPLLVTLPPGRFVMGADPDQVDPSGNETPRHEVAIAAPPLFGAYEVTVAHFRRFVEASGYRPQRGCTVWTKNTRSWAYERDRGWDAPGYPIEDERRPVVCVSWDDATAYALWLSRETGQRYRLPSEAEWEYAARSWTQTRYAWGDHLPRNRAACDGCGSLWDIDRPAPVGSFPPNFFGLHDMHGNVWEWVEDCWHEGYAGAPADGSAWLEGGDCDRRVIRGGGTTTGPDTLRSANRLRDGADKHHGAIGFRVVREAEAAEAPPSRAGAG